MYPRIDGDRTVEHIFDKIAGAAFALGWLNSFAQNPSGINAPIFGWMLSMNALAASDPDTNLAEQLVMGFDGLVVAPTAFDLDSGQQFRNDLVVVAQHEWSFWLPLLLFSPAAHRERHWSTYQARFSAPTEEERALRRLLFELLSEPHLELLFTPDIASRYTSLAETVVIRVGKILKELKATTEDEQQQVYNCWYDFTREALNRVHSGLRLSRTSRPDASEYIDLLLALLAVVEWRTQPDIWRIPTFIESYQHYPEEVLTSRQIALSSTLFGYFEGYHRVAAGVQQRPLRRLLAGQVMALVGAHYDSEVIGNPSFYLPLNAQGPDPSWIITDEIESRSTTHRHWSQKKGPEPDVTLARRTSIRVVVPELDLRFFYDCERNFPGAAQGEGAEAVRRIS